MKPRALDLFCGAGGATRGLQLAGFHVTGVDINPQPRYVGDVFIQCDALHPRVLLSDFDLVWASPPCQRYMLSGLPDREKHPDLLPLARQKLRGAEPCLHCGHERDWHQGIDEDCSSCPCMRWLPSGRLRWVIENVPGAPMRRDLVLCGSHFGLEIRRHRWFESDNGWLPPFTVQCDHRGEIAGVYGSAHGKNGAWSNGVTKKMLPSDRTTWSRAMGIDWMTCHELTQAIPPAYSAFIGRAALLALTPQAVAS